MVMIKNSHSKTKIKVIKFLFKYLVKCSKNEGVLNWV